MANDIRGINELIDLPYSEMTDAEIESVVEFKAANAARDFAHSQVMEELRAHNERMAAIAESEANAHRTALEERRARAFARLKAVENG